MITFQFVPFQRIRELDSHARVSTLLDIVKNDKIVVMEGRLKKHEEAELIETTMEAIDKQFSGIELGVIYPEKKNVAALEKFRSSVARLLLGDREGMTVIGPANVVKRIIKNPDHIELFMKETAARKGSRKKRKK